MSTLAQLRDRVEQVLGDTSNAIYSTTAIDEAIRRALETYSNARPYELENAAQLEAPGRQIDLTNVLGRADALHITEVWWPYDPTAEKWPPNRVRGFHTWRDAGAMYLLLDLEGNEGGPDSQPQTGDYMRIWFTTRHTIQDLDAAAATTVYAHHEGLLVTGASGYAAASHAADKADSREYDAQAVEQIRKFAANQLAVFQQELTEIQRADARKGRAFGPGWRLDKWDNNYNHR